MPTEGVGFMLNLEKSSHSPDSGCRSDSKEVQSVNGMSPQLSGNSPCCLCCERTQFTTQLATCSHSFCATCLKHIFESQMISDCPKCQSDVQLSHFGLSDNALSKTVLSVGTCSLLCGLCKTGEVIANCVQCVRLLCKTCSTVHDPDHMVIRLVNKIGCFHDLGLESDLVGKCHCRRSISSLDAVRLNRPNRLLDFSRSLMDFSVSKNVTDDEFCMEHKSETAEFYCKTCRHAACRICTSQGSCINHEYTSITDMIKAVNDAMIFQAENAKVKISDILNLLENLDATVCRLRGQYEESQASIDKTFNFFTQALQELQEEMSFELKNIHDTKMSALSGTKVDLINNLTDLRETYLLMSALVPLPSTASLVPTKQDVVDRVERLLEYKPEVDSSSVEFVSNHQAIQIAVRNTFGYIRHDQKNVQTAEKIYGQADFATPCNSLCNDDSPFVNSFNSSRATVMENRGFFHQSYPKKLTLMQPKLNIESQVTSGSKQKRDNFRTLTTQPATAQNLYVSRKSSGPLGNKMFDCHTTAWPTVRLPITASPTIQSCENDTESTLKAIVSDTSPVLPPRAKMEYHCKFGEYGSESSQFTEPSGLAVNHLNKILVADANNHRIQVFDKNGTFRCIIGQDGRGDCDLVYPNRLAVDMRTGDIFVTERSPTHQVQVYNQHGRFIRRFGAHILQHPRGITVDRFGRVIVVECRVMRVVIFSASGSVINRFVVDKHVDFPNGVAVNDAEEIFISDNRRHGIVVFDYQGRFLRTIGGRGITNYPIGVGINSVGEVVVADNHNNFNVTVFSQNGRFIRAMESRVKHAQCFDVALMGASSIVLSSKDFRIYLYKYAPSSGLHEINNQLI